MRHAEHAVHDRLDERQFSLVVRRLADSLNYGSDASPFLGAGIEFVQSRPYVPGDSVKTIDWRVTARTGRVHVKEYEAPKRVPVYILIDTSGSMCIRSVPVSKYAWAVALAGGLALAAQQRLSPVGLLGCGERDVHILPTLARTDILRWANHLRHADVDESTNLGARLRELLPMLDNRCLLIVLSDLHDPDAVDALKLAVQRHDVAVLQLQDPAEEGCVGGGIFRGREAETGRQFVAHGRRRWFDPDAVTRGLRTAGIDCILLRTDEPFVPRLRYFLAKRHLFGRR